MDVPGQPLTPVPAPALSAAQTQKPSWLELQPRWPPDPCRDPGCTHWKSGGSRSRGGGGYPLVPAAAATAPLRPQLFQLWPPVRPWHPQSLPRLPRPLLPHLFKYRLSSGFSREKYFFKKKKEKENDTPSYIPLITTPPLGPIHLPFPLPFASHRLGAGASLARRISAVVGGRGGRVLPGLGLFVLG